MGDAAAMPTISIVKKFPTNSKIISKGGHVLLIQRALCNSFRCWRERIDVHATRILERD